MVNGCFVTALMIVPAGSSLSVQRRVVCAWGADCGPSFKTVFPVRTYWTE